MNDLEGALAALSSEAWLGFLAGRRWFPAGARGAHLLGAAPLGGSAALALVAVDAPRPYTAQVLLDMSDPSCPPEHLHEGGTRALRLGPGRAAREAADAPAAFAALEPALRRGGAFAGARARWVATPVGPGWRDPGGPARRAAAETSNTSVVFGESAFFKLFRRVEPGRHPELELGRYLTARRFPHCPPLLAELLVETDAGPAAAGTLHAFLPGRTLGWALALARGRSDMSQEASSLGAATRALHEALAAADGDLAPAPVRPEDRARWSAGLRDQAEAALGRLTTASLPELRAQAREAAARARLLVADADERLRAADGLQIRVHGDYHLGQVLYEPSSRSWSILDFEGEPSRPLAERARPQLPLRDLASMVRSFGYAAIVGGGGSAWEQATRAAFIAGYDAAAPPGSPLPRAEGSPLLRACVIERVLYELAYELDYRPENAWIPLSAILAMAR